MQQIAKMYGALGFKVNISGLKEFKNHLMGARKDVTVFANSTRVLRQNLNKVGDALVRVNQNLKIKKSDTKLETSYVQLASAVTKVDKAFQSITKNQGMTTNSFGKIHSSIIFGEKRWRSYADQVERTKKLLATANTEMKTLRANTSMNLRVPTQQTSQPAQRSGWGNGGGSNRIPQQPSVMQQMKSDVFGFAGAMGSPAALMMSGAAAAGYVTKQVITTAREQQQMKQALLFASKQGDGGADYEDSLKFIQSESLRLGMDSSVVGKTFATIRGAAQEKLNKQDTMKMFSGMSEYFTAVKASDLDKSLMWLAVQQMFSIGKLEGQEVGQLTGRGLITRKQLNDAIMKSYGLKDTSKIGDMQKAGKLDPAKFMPVLAATLAEQAGDTGALQKALDSSLIKENIMKERFRQFSDRVYEGGLDTALKNIYVLGEKIVAVLEKFEPLLKEIIETGKTLVSLIKTLSGYMDSAFGEGSGVITGLALITMWFLKKTVAVNRAIGAARFATGVFGKLGAFFTTLAIRIIPLLLNKFNLIGLAIWAIAKIARDVNRTLAGETTWINVWMARFKTIGKLFEYEIAKLSLRWTLFQMLLSGQSGTERYKRGKALLGEEVEGFGSLAWRSIKDTPLGTALTIGTAALAPMINGYYSRPSEQPTPKNWGYTDQQMKEMENSSSGGGSNSIDAARMGTYNFTLPINIDGQKVDEKHIKISNGILIANWDA